MKEYATLIVDDELDARKALKSYIDKYCPTLKIVGEAANINDAKKIIETVNPEIVFLDIEMPYGNAFDLIDQLHHINFEIIFVTAFSEYAIDAINLSAAHYLLKPISIDQLIEASDKAIARIRASNQNESAKILLENIQNSDSANKKIVLPLLDGFEVKKPADILYCEAQDNFTLFYFTDGTKSLICRNLKFYEAVLSKLGFVRIHRSYIINIDYVIRYRKGKGGRVVLTDNKELDVSQSRKQEFLRHFK